jgi:hypothetical protein
MSSPDLFATDSGTPSLSNPSQGKKSPRLSNLDSPKSLLSEKSAKVIFVQESLGPLLETQSRGWRPNTLARRQSSVGAVRCVAWGGTDDECGRARQDLFFENAKDIGRTVIISEILDSRAF